MEVAKYINISDPKLNHSLKGTRQKFAFKCKHSGELAIYTKAALTLDRDVITRKLIGAKSNIRTRSKAGEEISAQAALLGRSKSCNNVMRCSSFGEQELRAYPLYCYPNTWLTRNELEVELPKRSKTFHDLRNGSTDEIASINLEVLRCTGLPKLDKGSNANVYCFVVCGSLTFVTDVIPVNHNSCWLPLSRRACILPLLNAYSQVYVVSESYSL